MSVKSEAGDYLSQFFTNLGNDLGLEAQKGEVEAVVEQSMESQLRSSQNTEHLRIGTEDVSKLIEENVTQRPESLRLVQSKFHIFEDCREWGDVFKQVAKGYGKVYRESFFIQAFGAGVALVFIDNVTPVGKFIVGPILIRMGSENSQLLKKVLNPSDVATYTKVDWSKGFKKSV